jgi:hypothetical protein
VRTLAICLLALGTVGLASDGSGRRVTVVHDLVVAPVIHADAHSNEPSNLATSKPAASRRAVSHARRARPRHAEPERGSILARFGRAIGITVRHR